MKVVLVGPPGNVIFQKCLQMLILDNFLLSKFLYRDSGSGILNVLEANKHLNTMQIHWVIQIRQNIFSIPLLRTIASFIQDHHVFFVEKLSNRMKKK